MLERDLIPVPCSTRAGAETAASLARSISASESIIVIVLASRRQSAQARPVTPVIPLPEEVLRFLTVQQLVKVAACTRPDDVVGPE
jgi:hypothetical protein